MILTKRFQSLFLVMAILISAGVPAFADNEVTEEKIATKEDQESLIRDGKFIFTPSEFCEIIERTATDWLKGQSYYKQFDVKVAFDEDDVCLISFDGDPVAILQFYPGENSVMDDLKEEEIGKEENGIGRIWVRCPNDLALLVMTFVFSSCDPTLSQLDPQQLFLRLTRIGLESMNDGSGYNASLTENGILYRIPGTLQKDEITILTIEPDRIKDTKDN